MKKIGICGIATILLLVVSLSSFVGCAKKTDDRPEIERVKERVEQIKNGDTSYKIYEQGEFYGVQWIVTEDNVLILTGRDELNGEDYNNAPWKECDKKIKGAYVSIENATTFTCLFSYMKDLIYFDITDTYSGNVTNMSEMFYGCESIVEIDMTQIDTSNVRYMLTMFRGCHSLEEIDCSKMITSNVEDMSLMFMNCYNLRSLDLSSFDTSKVKRMSLMFTISNGSEDGANTLT